MHTLPARLGALFDSTHTSAGLPQLFSHSSSSHGNINAPPRRLPTQTSLHAALPRIGVVAVPDESLATSAAARLSQQQQQQQSQPQQPAAYAPPRRVQVRRTRVGQWPQQQQQQDVFTQQPTQLLQKQLTDVQLATQAQQQQLWQAQQYQGRQQAWPGQSQQAGTNTSKQQSPSSGRHPSAADWQQPPQQQWQAARGYQPDHQDGSHAPQWQQRPAQQQQQQQQQRAGQGQGYQPRPQQQQQSGPRWGLQGGASGWQQSDRNQQQQPGRQQQQQQRHPHHQQHSKRLDQQRLSQPDLSEGASASSAATSSDSSNSSSSSSSGAGQHSLRFNYGLKQDWSLPTGLAVTYLGSSSGAPTKDRNVSCTVLRLPESLYLVDCGEGSSRQAKLTGLPLEQVEAVFITHLHGDHCFGIGTMLVAMCKARKAAAAAAAANSTNISTRSDSDGGQLAGPDGPAALRLVGPPRLGEVVSAMLFVAGVGRQLDQPVYITEFVDSHSEAHDWQPLPVPAAAASVVNSGRGTPHCPAFIRRMAPTQELPEHEWPAGLARRLDRTGLRWQDGNARRSTFRATPGLLWQIPCSQVTVTAAQLQHRVPCWGYVFEEKPPAAAAAVTGSSSSSGSSSGVRGRRVVLLGDTVDSRPIAPVALGADLVSHEATFAAGMEGKAAVAQHSTAWMAGQFAWAIQAKALVLTHFSARYEGSRERSKWVPAGADSRDRRGGGGGYDAAAADAMEEERTIKALQREADDQYGLGPVGLAIDLLTAHVPKQQQAEDGEGGGADA